MFWRELKAMTKNKMMMVGLIVALFIPTLYSASFLWAFWDPYDHTENLKVAVVNEDQPVNFQGKDIHFGGEIKDQLVKDKNFEWEFVEKDKAMDGLQDNTYSMMIEIPHDFSKKVSNVFTDQAEQPVIYHVPNQAKNYMISMVQNSMVQQLKNNISETLTEVYITSLASSILETEAGIVQVTESMDELVDGLVALQEPMEGSVQVNAAIPSDKKEVLKGSLDEIILGARELTSGLGENVEAAKGVSMEEENIKIAAQPLELTEKPYTEVPNYGNGFAPFTLSLGLFIGAMVLMMVFPATTPMTEQHGMLSWFGSKFGVIAVAAILQAVIVDMVLLYGLGITVENTALFFLFTAVVSLAFVMILHFLSAVFKDAGRVLMMLMIILQITASGGTFPTEMVPSFLQKVSLFLPMTYSIKGFRSLVSNDHYSLMWQQTGYLTVFFIVALFGSLVYFLVTFRRRGKTKITD